MIDLGLRLDDVTEEGLDPEEVSHGNIRENVVARNLRESGASEDEVEFLMSQRVELNAFTADSLVEWVEKKLDDHDVEKVVPDKKLLEEAYRREKQSAFLKDKFAALLKESAEFVKDIAIPDDLDAKVREILEDNRELPWNEAVAKLAE